MAAVNPLCVQNLQGSADSPESCRGRCRSQPFATKERYGCGSAACRYTSAHWAAADLSQIPIKTEAVFLVGSRGLRGGNRNPPRARFLFAAFSFGEAKEKVGRQPQISNMRFVLLYVWLVVCVKGMRNLLSSLYYRDSLFVNYHSSLRLSSPLDRFGRM